MCLTRAVPAARSCMGKAASRSRSAALSRMVASVAAVTGAPNSSVTSSESRSSGERRGTQRPAAGSAGGLVCAAAVKRNDINVSLLFNWRRRLRETDGEAGSGGFVPVIVAPAGDALASDGHFGASLSAGRFFRQRSSDDRRDGGCPGAGADACGRGQATARTAGPDQTRFV